MDPDAILPSRVATHTAGLAYFARFARGGSVFMLFSQDSLCSSDNQALNIFFSVKVVVNGAKLIKHFKTH